mmetsp:Transcript_6815/g.16580  ORF Transcript_6815/g.16580 Transcript_6815/m.16580 type:complete len:245 (-) Transcript_6815:307-1041(-)
MSEESDSEADAVVGALEQPRNVQEVDGVVVELHDAEVRDDGREGVIRDLGPRIRHRCEKRGLPRVGGADESRVGQQLELEAEPACVGGLAALGEPRGDVSRGFEGLVAAAAAAAACGEEDLAVGVEVAEDDAGVAVADDGAEGDVEGDVGALDAVSGLAHAGLALGCAEVDAGAEAGEGVAGGGGFEVDGAAVAAVAAAGAAAGVVFLVAHGHAAVAAEAALDVDVDGVEEEPVGVVGVEDGGG